MESKANKVALATLSFWIMKICATTVGETGADLLIFNLGFGLAATSLLMSVLLVVVLFCQVKAKTYIPWLYWSTVVSISIVGTLITDNLTDNLEVPLGLSTAVFIVALIITFAIWYAKEKTLSIHTIDTYKRELFYWAAILVTFALGTAAGDYASESFGLGYALSGMIFGAMIVAIIAGYFILKLNALLAFWLAYILTRPLGASLGDYLAQSTDNGGLGFGTTHSSAALLVIMLSFIVYLSRKRSTL